MVTWGQLLFVLSIFVLLGGVGSLAVTVMANMSSPTGKTVVPFWPAFAIILGGALLCAGSWWI